MVEIDSQLVMCIAIRICLIVFVISSPYLSPRCEPNRVSTVELSAYSFVNALNKNITAIF